VSLYGLQKLIREINRNPAIRARFEQAPEALLAEWELTADERAALIGRDYGRLYRMGVHGLLLRPFSILHGVPEPEYLGLIRDTA
jgi:hypothetical protein